MRYKSNVIKKVTYNANTEEEKVEAEEILNEVNKKLNGKVVTTIRKEKNYCKLI